MSAGEFEWVGGRLCLDFVNTVDWSEKPGEDERLRDYRGLVEWAAQAGLLAPGRRAALERVAEDDPRAARRALAQAHRARRVIHDLFAALGSGRPVGRKTLDAFNAQLGPALAASRLVPAKGGFIRQWSADSGDLGQFVRPVLADAAELAVGEQRGVVRACANDRCGWLFVDTSHNHLRRWCDMRACGNRAKAHRHYQRVRAGRRPGGHRAA